MSGDLERASDAELVTLFDLDSVAELNSIAAGKRGMLFIATCDGQFAKYEGETTWRFQADVPEPDVE